MLHTFSINNYRSIKQAELDLSFKEGKAPSGYRELEDWIFLEQGKNNRLVPCLAMYGANACGKTNIISALHDLQQIVVFGLDDCISNHFSPNKIIPSGDIVSFNISFFQNSKSLKYKISFNNSEITSESLYIDNNIIFSLVGENENFSGLPQGENDAVNRFHEIRKIECFAHKKQNKTFLSRLATQYQGLDENIFNIFAEIRDIEIHRMSDLSLNSLFRENKSISSYELDKYLKKITILLAKLDFDITKLIYDERIISPSADNILLRKQSRLENEKINLDSIRSYRKDINGNEVEFNFNEDESNGTKILVSLLILCLFVLKNGKTLVIDELGRALHPAVLDKIVRLFKSKRYNTKNAQLIFTTHETELLDSGVLRASEIGIVSKTLNKGTEIFRVVDFDGTRNILNFRRQYLNGSFGGIPLPYI